MENNEEFASARDALSMLLRDETDAVDAYDKVLRCMEFSEEDRVKLERIRNAEINHIKDLSEIYQKYSTANVVGKDSLGKRWCIVRDSYLNGLFRFMDEDTKELYKVDGTVIEFSDRGLAESFYLKSLYDDKAWRGRVPIIRSVEEIVQ